MRRITDYAGFSSSFGIQARRLCIEGGPVYARGLQVFWWMLKVVMLSKTKQLLPVMEHPVQPENNIGCCTYVCVALLDTQGSIFTHGDQLTLCIYALLGDPPWLHFPKMCPHAAPLLTCDARAHHGCGCSVSVHNTATDHVVRQHHGASTCISGHKIASGWPWSPMKHSCRGGPSGQQQQEGNTSTPSDMQEVASACSCAILQYAGGWRPWDMAWIAYSFEASGCC